MLTPAWIASQRRDRGMCEQCGQEPYITEWASSGKMIGRECCEARQAANAANSLPT